MKKRFDHRRKYYMILDCETATLPFASKYTAEDRKKIAIAKPLIYDFGYQIIDNKGRVYCKRSFLVTEIFSVPSVFNTAYFADKRPIYLERLKKEETTLKNWHEIAAIFEEDLAEITAVGAYNAMFDFKKAIPFTDNYIKHLYSPEYNDWEKNQERICDDIVNGKKKTNERVFDKENFNYHDNVYPMFDLWGLSCKHILNNKNYKEMCVSNDWYSSSKKYFSTTAEKTFAYVTNNLDFSESHTAIDDAEIESIIFSIIAKKTKNKIEMGIIYFPFRILGAVAEFLT